MLTKLIHVNHFAIYTNTKLLHCTSETNIFYQVYLHWEKKQNPELVVPRTLPEHQ